MTDQFDHRMRRAVAIPFVAGAGVVLAIANAPGWTEPVARGPTNLLALLGLLGALFIWRFPWQRFPRNLFLLVTYGATVLIAALVRLNGDSLSPFESYYFLVVVFAALYYDRRTALLVAATTSLATLLPAMYSTPGPWFWQWQLVLAVGLVVTVWVQSLMVGEVVRRERARRGLEADLTEVRRLRDELAKANEQLSRQATTDVLTGLPNHRALVARLDEEVERARRYGHGLSVIFLDVDHFKLVNDTYGHQAGDEVLQRLAGLGVEMLRAADTLGRYGGEEFVAVLPETGHEEALRVAERLRVVISARSLVIEGVGLVPVTASLGVATREGSEATRGELLGAADRALYGAKAAGRNRVCSHQDLEARGA